MHSWQKVTNVRQQHKKSFVQESQL